MSEETVKKKKGYTAPSLPPVGGSRDETTGSEDRGIKVVAFKSWATLDPTTFYGIRSNWYSTLKDDYGLDVTEAQVGRVLEAWAEAYREGKTGVHATTDATGTQYVLPTILDLENDPTPWVMLQRNIVGTDKLPKTFAIQAPEGAVQYYRNDPSQVMPVAVSKEELHQEAVANEAFGTRGQPGMSSATAAYASDLLRRESLAVPTIPQEIVDSLLKPLQQQQTRSGGSGRRISFDKDQLIEAIRDRWRVLLREEPGNAGVIADEYIAAASDALRAGQPKDFDTWVLNRIRKEDRYGLLYARKDESQSELDYLNSFVPSVEGYGLPTRLAEQHLQRGMSTGAAPASFAESVAGSRDVASLGTGGLSRRFANLLNQLGPLAG